MKQLNLRLKNLVKELHIKICNFLTKNYDVIFIPEYKQKNLYSKKNNNKTNRKSATNYAFFKFKTLLAYHCAKNGSVMVTVSESYSSKACSKCGNIHVKLGSNKIFNCPHCNHSIDRDMNGAINIFNNSLVLSQAGLGY